MADVIRSWVPVPAWWIPVWVTLDGGDATRDPLEDAIVALVGAGVRGPRDMARSLCVHVALVESAAQGLIAKGALALDGDTLVLPAARAPAEQPRALSGWLAWNPRVRRPVLQLWLDREIPSVTTAPPGWRLAPWAREEHDAPPPGDGAIEDALRILPDTRDLRALMPVGESVREVDGARVRRLRRRPTADRERGPIWVPVEQRVHGPVVWRPSVVPTPEVETELDPAGWDGLLEATQAGARRAAEADLAELRDRVAPGVLREAGYASVAALQEAARAEAERELGTLDSWPQLRDTVASAYVSQTLTVAAGGHWRPLAQAWANVLEVATMEVARRLERVLGRLDPGAWDPDDARLLRRRLGPTWPMVEGVLRREGELKDLRQRLRRGADSVGERIVAFGVCVALDRPTRDAFALVLDAHPDLFAQLDTARAERNAAVHHRRDAEVAVAAFRARVLLVCKALARLDLPAA